MGNASKHSSTRDIDAFNSKSTESGFVNDVIQAPIRYKKLLERFKKRNEQLEDAKKSGGY